MNKNLLIGVVIVIVLLIGVVAFKRRHNNSYMPGSTTSGQPSTVDNTGSNGVSPSMNQNGSTATSVDSINKDLNSLDQSLPSDSDLGSQDPTQ